MLSGATGRTIPTAITFRGGFLLLGMAVPNKQTAREELPMLESTTIQQIVEVITQTVQLESLACTRG
jgi:hypothetical protein